jgi:hypothetical protein
VHNETILVSYYSPRLAPNEIREREVDCLQVARDRHREVQLTVLGREKLQLASQVLVCRCTQRRMNCWVSGCTHSRIYCVPSSKWLSHMFAQQTVTAYLHILQCNVECWDQLPTRRINRGRSTKIQLMGLLILVFKRGTKDYSASPLSNFNYIWRLLL